MVLLFRILFSFLGLLLQEPFPKEIGSLCHGNYVTVLILSFRYVGGSTACGISASLFLQVLMSWHQLCCIFIVYVMKMYNIKPLSLCVVYIYYEYML